MAKTRGTRSIDGTTEQQKLFAYAYFNNRGNGTEAAKTAGYSAKSATAVASRLLTYANIKALLKELQDEVRERAIVTKEQIAAELAKIGFSDIRKLFDENNRLLDIKEIPDDIAATLSSVEVDQLWGFTPAGKVQTGETKKVKIWDKIRALSALVDLYGFNAPKKVAQTDKDGNDVPQYDLSKLSNEELKLLIKLQSKIGVSPAQNA